MATYIHYSIYGAEEQDATVQGAEWLEHVIEQQQGPEASRKFHDQFIAVRAVDERTRDYDAAAVFDLFVDHSKDLFAAIPESTGNRSEDRLKEVESFFALVLSLLISFEDADSLDASTERLCKLFTENAETQTDMRLRMMMMLYNTFSDPKMPNRYRVFKHIIDYSAKAGLFESTVMPYLEYLDDWMVDWEKSEGMKEKDKRKLFLDLSEYMRKLGQGKRVDAFLYLKRYAQLFQGEKDDVLKQKEVQDSTIQLLKDALQLSSVIQFDDILALDTVKALGKTQNKQLIELCKLFLNGDVKDLDVFYKKNGAMFKEHNLDYGSAMAKMRLLTLATKVHGRSEISLQEVAKALEEEEDKVQEWVVQAVSEGVIDGRIDQLNQKVLVKSAFQREFGKAEWAFLDSKLTQWTENLENVIKFIGEQKQLREGAAAA